MEVIDLSKYDKSREIRLWTKLIWKIVSVFITAFIFIPSLRSYCVSKLEYWKLRTEQKIDELKERRGEKK